MSTLLFEVIRQISGSNRHESQRRGEQRDRDEPARNDFRRERHALRRESRCDARCRRDQSERYDRHVRMRETDDGFVIVPGTPRPAKIWTYHDHRMAMAFSLLGLRAPGIAIGDPACVAKTFPRFFETLDTLR